MNSDLYQSQNGVAPVDNIERASNELQHSSESPIEYDWEYEQKPLLARWDELTPNDFAMANGDRARFVEQLARRGGISMEDASVNLSAFESRRPVNWRARTERQD